MNQDKQSTVNGKTTMHANEETSLETKAAASVLLVDDEKNILTSLTRLLRQQGYQIFTALSGAEGLSMLEKQDIDLVISDMRMPEMDGAEFLEIVNQKWPDTSRLLLTGYADISSTVAAINKGKIYAYISKPWDDNDLKLNVANALERKFLASERRRLEALTQKQNEELKDLNANLANKVEARTEELRQAMGQLELTNESLKKNYLTTIKIFSNLIEIREGSLAGHAKGVAEVARKIAQKLKLDSENIQNIFIAGLLINIGKIGLSDSIILTPYEELKPADQLHYRKHPIIGEGILMALEPLQESARLIRCQHEHYDGKGYPDQLAKTDIPTGARILALASDYQSMKYGASGKEKPSEHEILDFVRENREKRYDPEVVDAFFEVIGVSKAEKPSKKIDIVRSNGLFEGMVVARDIKSKDGVLLLSEGVALSDSLIERLQRFEKSVEEDLEIHVFTTGS